jgi:hypothetical protein
VVDLVMFAFIFGVFLLLNFGVVIAKLHYKKNKKIFSQLFLKHRKNHRILKGVFTIF